MKKQKSIIAELAMRVIKSEILHRDFEITEEIKNCEDLLQEAACYVVIHTQNNEMRACIGNAYPSEENLMHEIIRNAKQTVANDNRYRPLSEHDVENIMVSVDVLGVPYLINDLSELDPKHKGIIVSHEGKKGLLLPNTRGVETSEEQLIVAKQKAGLDGIETDELQISIFTSTRFE